MQDFQCVQYCIQNKGCHCSPQEGVEGGAPLPGDFRMIVCLTPPQINDFGDLLGTPYAPVSKIAPVNMGNICKIWQLANSSQFIFSQNLPRSDQFFVRHCNIFVIFKSYHSLVFRYWILVKIVNCQSIIFKQSFALNMVIWVVEFSNEG